MLTIGSCGVKVYLHTGKTDMRKGINGLSVLANSILSGGIADGALFVFSVSANLKCTTNLHEKCTTKKGHKIKSVNVNIDSILIQNEVVLYDRYSNVYNNTNLAQTRR